MRAWFHKDMDFSSAWQRWPSPCGYQHLALVLDWAAHAVAKRKMRNIFAVACRCTLFQQLFDLEGICSGCARSTSSAEQQEKVCREKPLVLYTCEPCYLCSRDASLRLTWPLQWPGHAPKPPAPCLSVLFSRKGPSLCLLRPLHDAHHSALGDCWEMPFRATILITLKGKWRPTLAHQQTLWTMKSSLLGTESVLLSELYKPLRNGLALPQELSTTLFNSPPPLPSLFAAILVTEKTKHYYLQGLEAHWCCFLVGNTPPLAHQLFNAKSSQDLRLSQNNMIWLKWRIDVKHYDVLHIQ